MAVTNWQTVDWPTVNELLRELLDYYSHPGAAQRPLAAKEQAFFAALDPYIAHMGQSGANKYDWPPLFGSSNDEIAGELRQRCTQQLLTTLRGGRDSFKAGEIQKAYLWQILNSVRSHAWTGRDAPEPLENIIATEADSGPSLDEQLAGKELRLVPADVRERLEDLFAPAPPDKQSQQRRQMLVLLHLPFIAHGGNDDWELAISSGELAALLGVPNYRITRDRDDLGKRLGAASHRRYDWYLVTRISTRLALAQSSAAYMLEPQAAPPAQAPDHATTMALLRSLLRLIQVDELAYRMKLRLLQDSAPDIYWETAGYELRLALDTTPLWAGDKVSVLEIAYLHD